MRSRTRVLLSDPAQIVQRKPSYRGVLLNQISKFRIW